MAPGLPFARAVERATTGAEIVALRNEAYDPDAPDHVDYWVSACARRLDVEVFALLHEKSAYVERLAGRLLTTTREAIDVAGIDAWILAHLDEASCTGPGRTGQGLWATLHSLTSLGILTNSHASVQRVMQLVLPPHDPADQARLELAVFVLAGVMNVPRPVLDACLARPEGFDYLGRGLSRLLAGVNAGPEHWHQALTHPKGHLNVQALPERAYKHRVVREAVWPHVGRLFIRRDLAIRLMTESETPAEWCESLGRLAAADPQLAMEVFDHAAPRRRAHLRRHHLVPLLTAATTEDEKFRIMGFLADMPRTQPGADPTGTHHVPRPPSTSGVSPDEESPGQRRGRRP